ncbi:MAG: glycosyltransferase family 39 protein [Chloroflexi bacterium]|nr:glycosyltransferase family 39 protein [Chloroflexota bacterium]
MAAGYAASALTLLAMALRLFHIDFQSLWWDEGISLYLAGASWQALTVSKDLALDLHPPLYYGALSLWGQAVGPSAFASRLFSVYAGVLAIPLLYQLSRTMTSKPVGIVAAGLLAISPVHIFYSQEARMYPLTVLFALGATLAAVRIWTAEHSTVRWGAWWAYVVMMALGLYNYYYVGLLWLALNIGVGLLRKRELLRPWLAAQGAVIALYLPWLVVLARLALGGYWQVAGGSTAALTDFWRTTWWAFTVGFFESRPWTTLLAVLFLFLAGLGLFGQWRAPSLRWQALIWLLGPIVFAYLISLWRPFYFPRFILFGIIPLYSLVGAGLAVWRGRWAAVAIPITAALLASSFLSLRYYYTMPRTAYASSDYLVTQGTLGEFAQPGDAVLVSQAWQAGYLRGYLPQVPLQAIPIDARWLADRAALDAELAKLVNNNERIWLLTWSGGDPWLPNPVEEQLGQMAVPRLKDGYGDTRLRLFTSAKVAVVEPAFPEMARQRLEGGPDLLGYRLARRGSDWEVALFWRAEEPISASYTVFVHALDGNGRILAQADGIPFAGAYPTQEWTLGEIIIDRHILSGEALRDGWAATAVGMYDAMSGRRLSVGTGDHILLPGGDSERAP